MRFFVAVFGVFARSSGGDTPQPFGWSSLGVPLIRIPKTTVCGVALYFFRLAAHTICTRAGEKNQSRFSVDE